MVDYNIDTITVVTGDGTETTVEVPNTTFAIYEDGDFREPFVTTNITYEKAPQNETLTDQCGRTERRNLGDLGWNLTVEGIVVDAPQSAVGENLTPNDFVELLSDGSATIFTSFVDGDIVVDGGQFTENTDIHKFLIRGDLYDAYPFQLQLGEQNSDEGS